MNGPARPTIADLLAPWTTESAITEEPPRRNQRGGWTRWNGMSPEVEICEAMAAIIRLIRPMVVLETGVGQGYLTRRAVAALPKGATYLGFESSTELREGLAKLAFFRRPDVSMAEAGTPNPAQFAAADLAILDSAFDMRFDEVDRWLENAPQGAYVFVHDTGNGHPPWTFHMKLAAHLESRGIPGVFLSNPRGSFFGRKR